MEPRSAVGRSIVAEVAAGKKVDQRCSDEREKLACGMSETFRLGKGASVPIGVVLADTWFGGKVVVVIAKGFERPVFRPGERIQPWHHLSWGQQAGRSDPLRRSTT